MICLEACSELSIIGCNANRRGAEHAEVTQRMMEWSGGIKVEALRVEGGPERCYLLTLTAVQWIRADIDEMGAIHPPPTNSYRDRIVCAT